MKLAIVHCRASAGVDAPEVTVEVHISDGLPALSLVGLPETAIKESRDRVRSAIMNSHFDFPARRITVNLAPADLPKKDGGRFDLPIALGILAASDQIPDANLGDYEFAGELALCGTLRGFHGALPFALATRHTGRKLIIPLANTDEAALARDVVILPVTHLLDVCMHFTQEKLLASHHPQTILPATDYTLDLIDIRGQQYAKRALEIAAAGQHSLLMTGPPGTGKTMLASRLPTILPDMTDDEALTTAAVNSISGKKFNLERWKQRPFRSPHHTASSVALVGGSSPPRPGEISLAHNGVLFLDELPEFNRAVLEALREPLESGSVTISRAAHQARFPANFQLVAAMNPCPCGHWGNAQGNCRCTSEQIQRYQARISGPMLDRIDMHLQVATLPRGLLTQGCDPTAETSATVRARVIKAREIQLARARKPNATLAGNEIEKFCYLSTDLRSYLETTLERLHISPRAYHRILKISRTIADLEGTSQILRHHLAEALSYRQIKA